jgi:hypothetical protein
MTSLSTTANVSAKATPKYGAAFFEHLWRGAGVQAVAFSLVGLAVFRIQPFIAAPILGLAILNLTWWAASVRTTLADAGLDGWGAAATAASSALAGIFFVLVALATTTASLAGTGNDAFVSGLNQLGSSLFVLSSFPRAMLVMAPTFGFWRAGLISDKQFVVGVALVILGVLGGTTWIDGTVWSPDGLFARIIWPALGLAFVVAASRVQNRAPSTKTGF